MQFISWHTVVVAHGPFGPVLQIQSLWVKKNTVCCVFLRFRRVPGGTVGGWERWNMVAEYEHRDKIFGKLRGARDAFFESEYGNTILHTILHTV